jgi:hypothetical protein
MRGRSLVLCGELGAATEVLERAVGLARRLWTAFLPWPQSFRAEVDLLCGRIDLAADRFEQAFALGCQLGDPCWEGIAGRGLGLVARARGDVATASRILQDTLQRSVRLPDAYLWGKAYALDTLCALAVEQRVPEAPARVDALMTLASQAGMRELVCRAHGHRAALGDAASAAAAPMLAYEIDNPVLQTVSAAR